MKSRLVDVGVDLARPLRDLLGTHALLPGLLGLLVCESLPLFRTPRAGGGFVPQLARFVPLAFDPSLVRPPGGQEQDDDHDDGNCDHDPNPRVHDISPLLATAYKEAIPSNSRAKRAGAC
jgi:hypothetical protein